MKKATALTLIVALTVALAMVFVTVGQTMASKSPQESPDPKLEQDPAIGTISTIDEAPPLPLLCGTSALESFSSTPQLPIVSNTTITDAITVSGVTAPYVFDVDLTLDAIHTWNSDLDIYLISPAGTRVALTTDNGGSNDDVFTGTLFDNDADVPVTDYSFSDGVTATAVTPEGTFFAFLGEDPNGTWILEISDDAGGDDGRLNSWTLDITTMTQMPTIVNTYEVTATVGAPISDNTLISGTLNVNSGADTYFWNAALFLDINHTWNSDLEMTLTSPAGTVSTISTDNGGSNDDVFAGTVFTGG